MTRRVHALHPDQDAHEAAQLFLDKRVSGAPVVENERLVGIISEKDCMRLLVERLFTAGPDPTTVGDLMTREVVTVSPETTATELATLFHESCYRRVPVVDGDRVVGVVSRRDVLVAVQQLLVQKRWVPQASLITRRASATVGPARNVAIRRMVS